VWKKGAFLMSLSTSSENCKVVAASQNVLHDQRTARHSSATFRHETGNVVADSLFAARVCKSGVVEVVLAQFGEARKAEEF